MTQKDSDKNPKPGGMFELPNFWEEDDYKPVEKLEEKDLSKNDNSNRKQTHKQIGKAIHTRLKLKKEKVAEVLTERVEKGTSIHFISNGNFDYWNIVTRMIELHGLKKAEFFGSTWTMNDANVQSLLGMIDDGTIAKASMVVGLYFLHREPVVADTLKCGLEDRAQRFKACENHAKVVLISDGIDFLVMEGSANFTANPRIEQFVLNNDEGLFNFHKDWMNGYIGE